jgi:hypothetical protein
MTLRTLAGATALALATAAPAAAQYEWTSSRPDGHAPIGVMGDHTHAAGEFMLSYRFMRMQMDGNRTGTEAVSTEEVLDDFMVAPLSMPMTMHMVGLMYAPADRITLMGMGSWVSQEMDHRTRMGMGFTTESSGFGDVGLSALVGLKQTGSLRAHANLGVSLPTGPVDNTDVTPASGGEPVQLPYPMQIGSGTVDVRPGLTVLGMTERLSWGLQGIVTVRTGENDRGWRMGDRVDGTGWAALRLSDRVSLSGRVAVASWGDFEGEDPAFGDPSMVPTVRTDLRRGTRVDVPLGLNYYVPRGFLAGHRLAVEWSIPVYQDLDGPQLETDWVLTLGWQKSFAPLGGHEH